MSLNKYASLAGGAMSAIPSDLADLALLDIKVVCELTGMKSTSIYSWVAAGKFPEPIRLGPRCTRWRAGDVRAWLMSIHEAQAEDLKQRLQQRAKKASAAAQAKRHQAAAKGVAVSVKPKPEV